MKKTQGPKETVKGTQPKQNTDSNRQRRILPTVWKVISWPFRWIIVKTDEHPDFVTASGTFVIAVVTIVLAMVGHGQLKAIRDQLTEAQTEFRFIQRAQVVLGNQAGTMMEIAYFGGKPQVAIYMKNEGPNPANDVVPFFHILTATPNKPESFQYASLNPHNVYVVGPTLGEHIPLVTYLPIDQTDAAAIEAGTMQLRVVGRVTYWDDFGTYCIPIGVVYFLNPPRFQALGVPPQSAICHYPTTDSETFSVNSLGVPGLTYHYLKGEMPFDAPPVQSSSVTK